jgi:curved DNA-binding protein CbpA
MINDPYKELEIDKEATLKDIKSKFRELSKKHHPDVKGNPHKFIKIKIAYDILCDPERRELFDKEGIIIDVSEEKQLQDTAKHNIVTLLKSVVANRDIMMKLDSVDLIKIMLDNIEMNKVKVTTGIGVMDQQIQAIKEVTERMECVEGDDLLTGMLEIEIKEKEGMIKKMSNELKVVEYMNALLKNYTYNFKNQVVQYVTNMRYY